MGAVRMVTRAAATDQRREKKEKIRRAARWHRISSARVARQDQWWSRWLSMWRRIGERAARALARKL